MCANCGPAGYNYDETVSTLRCVCTLYLCVWMSKTYTQSCTNTNTHACMHACTLDVKDLHTDLHKYTRLHARMHARPPDCMHARPPARTPTCTPPPSPRYANRAKNIKNKPKINEDPKDAMLREYKDEINRLRALLEMQAKGLAVELPAASDAPAPAPAPVESAAPPGLAAASAAAPAAAPPGMLASPAELPGGIAPAAMGPPPSLAPPPGLGPPPGLSLGPPPSLAPGTELPPVRTVVEKQIEVVEKVVEVVVEKVVEVDRPVEVIPKQHLDQRKAMQDYNASILEQRNRLGEELIAREDSAREADAARRALQQQMEEMKAKVMHGFGLKSQDAGEDLEVQIAKKERERRLMQAKLRAKKKKEAALEAERLQAEQEKKEAEEELQNAREEHETAERRQAKQRRRLEKKLAEVRAEMEDSASEFHRERQDLLQSIIDQNRELKLLEKVLGMILPSSEISKVP